MQACMLIPDWIRSLQGHSLETRQRAWECTTAMYAIWPLPVPLSATISLQPIALGRSIAQRAPAARGLTQHCDWSILSPPAPTHARAKVKWPPPHGSRWLSSYEGVWRLSARMVNIFRRHKTCKCNRDALSVACRRCKTIRHRVDGQKPHRRRVLNIFRSTAIYIQLSTFLSIMTKIRSTSWRRSDCIVKRYEYRDLQRLIRRSIAVNAIDIIDFHCQSIYRYSFRYRTALVSRDSWRHCWTVTSLASK